MLSIPWWLDFIQLMPTTPDPTKCFGSTYDAELDSSTQKLTSGASKNVAVVAAQPAYYTLTPSTNDTLAAGDSLYFVLHAFDQSGNPARK